MDLTPETLNELDELAEDVAKSTYHVFGNNLQRFMVPLGSDATLGAFADASLPSLDFDGWYTRARQSVRSMVGSGNLDWPLEREPRVALQLGLMRRIAERRISVDDFSADFLWVENNFDSNLRAFVEQIFRPFWRDFRKIIAPKLEAMNVQSSSGDLTHRLRDSSSVNPKTVFVVHGRNMRVRDALFSFLRAAGLTPLEWSEALALTGKGSPYIGEVLDTAFQAAQAVIVLLTPDDEVRLARELWQTGEADAETSTQFQARPNVLFEAGMAFGRNPDRTILVEVGAVKPFSDVAGRHVVRLNNDASSRHQLVVRLRQAGCALETDARTDWIRTGDFSGPSFPSGEFSGA